MVCPESVCLYSHLMVPSKDCALITPKKAITKTKRKKNDFEKFMCMILINDYGPTVPRIKLV